MPLEERGLLVIVVVIASVDPSDIADQSGEPADVPSPTLAVFSAVAGCFEPRVPSQIRKEWICL
jgi:uncharacterized OsmC-like protein